MNCGSKVGEKAIANPNSALVWEFVKCGNEFEDEMHLTIGSVAISKGLVIASDFDGAVHCLDAKTGKRHWSYDTNAAIWASPLIVDDKVYVADEAITSMRSSANGSSDAEADFCVASDTCLLATNVFPNVRFAGPAS